MSPPTTLDIKSIAWLEDFLYRFQNTVIVVSHDRHFMNQVCTHIADIDFGQIAVVRGQLRLLVPGKPAEPEAETGGKQKGDQPGQ